jgi:hypothetical protein
MPEGKTHPDWLLAGILTGIYAGIVTGILFISYEKNQDLSTNVNFSFQLQENRLWMLLRTIKKASASAGFSIGVPDGGRTHNHLIHSQVLCH